ncbi:type II toxin-antitoxin system VapC family toxin [Sorangium cellulosum]|uniref:type II toxin-antitoxin system VapC family toxin n=1 Tax=Sorangium cellulosum TaxID=56 RepID=UPI0003246A0D|nr:PIN domain-containing protein [Sorangium cellulosum]
MIAEHVTDTHALVWSMYAPSRLGSAATDAGSARIYVPAVVIAETIMVVERGRLPGIALAHLLPRLEAMRTSDNYRLTSLLPEVVLASHTLSAIPDIFDRLIVAEAIHRGTPLISKDSVIRQSALVTTLWDS